MQQKPSNGRIVHFFKSAEEPDVSMLITKVVDAEAGVVNGDVFHDGGSIEPVRDVKFSETGDAIGSWFWPARV